MAAYELKRRPLFSRERLLRAKLVQLGLVFGDVHERVETGNLQEFFDTTAGFQVNQRLFLVFDGGMNGDKRPQPPAVDKRKPRQIDDYSDGALMEEMQDRIMEIFDLLLFPELTDQLDHVYIFISLCNLHVYTYTSSSE